MPGRNLTFEDTGAQLQTSVARRGDLVLYASGSGTLMAGKPAQLHQAQRAYDRVAEGPDESVTLQAERQAIGGFGGRAATLLLDPLIELLEARAEAGP